jgi:hypothetical protein
MNTQDKWLNEFFKNTNERIKLRDGKLNEKAIKRGLHIKDYPVKWRQARELTLSDESYRPPTKTIFDEACKTYVELGGGASKEFIASLEKENK